MKRAFRAISRREFCLGFGASVGLVGVGFVHSSVNYLDGGVSIHEYSPDVGLGDSDVDTAAFQWLSKKHAGKPWYLRANTTYKVTESISLDSIGQSLIGGNPYTTKIIQLDDSKPVLLWAARWTTISRLSVGYESSYDADVPAIYVPPGRTVSMGKVSQVFIDKCGSGFHADGLFFSNEVNSLRVNDWRHIAVRVSSGTGNSWNNIYLNNNGGGEFPNFEPRTCESALIVENTSEQTFSQLNIEYCACNQEAFICKRAESVVINGLHIEGCYMRSKASFISAQYAYTQLLVSGFVFEYNNSGKSSSIFSVDPNISLTISNMFIRDTKVKGELSLIGAKAPSDGSAKIYVTALDDKTGDLISVAGKDISPVEIITFNGTPYSGSRSDEVLQGK